MNAPLDSVTYEYEIGAHYLAALINGDESGLTDEESEELREFFDCDLPGPVAREVSRHWATTDNADEFGRCEITGARGPTVNVQLVVMYELAITASGSV